MKSFDYAPGKQFEQYMENHLYDRGYSFRRQVDVGYWINTNKHHTVDLAIDSTLVELKYQRESGSTESKLMEEIVLFDMYLDTVTIYNKALIVLGGSGWSPYRKRFYLEGRYASRIKNDVRVITEDQFKEEYP